MGDRSKIEWTDSSCDAVKQPELADLAGAILCVHTCWGYDHAAPIAVVHSEAMSNGSRRHDCVRCDGTPISLIEGGPDWSDLPAGWSNPCSCWATGSHSHPGHCCFTVEACVDHDELARAWLEQLTAGDVPMWPAEDER